MNNYTTPVRLLHSLMRTGNGGTPSRSSAAIFSCGWQASARTAAVPDKMGNCPMWDTTEDVTHPCGKQFHPAEITAQRLLCHV